ncbi:PIN domain-containing protein [Streptomyces sp. NPDC059506]|uniref:PIN domain-containing protein n=1 Tax=Streptomyces TaxID=1883 RepID=UPI000CC960A2|nr:PIN domain-containing protein [Streptomyces sp. SCUT-3]PLW66261.1 DNA-binding protein [Streptomyces sp. DJ]QMV21995.1 DNA-binding protein [Streptomyces sp. SCUT-3]
MARNRVTSGGGTLVLDSQGLSLYLEQDRHVLSMVRSALERGANRVVSGATLIEARHAGVKPARWNFVLSQLDVKPLSVEWAKEAAQLLASTGLHGHKYAIDAMVAVTAVHQPGPVVMLTSDTDDMEKLCGERVTLVAV